MGSEEILVSVSRPGHVSTRLADCRADSVVATCLLSTFANMQQINRATCCAGTESAHVGSGQSKQTGEL
jgi:hypothetical protein